MMSATVIERSEERVAENGVAENGVAENGVAEPSRGERLVDRTSR